MLRERKVMTDLHSQYQTGVLCHIICGCAQAKADAANLQYAKDASDLE